MIDLELPHAVLFDGFVLVDRPADGGAPAHAHLLQHAAADLRAHPVGGDVDHRLQLQMVAEPAFDRAFLAAARKDMQQELPYPLATLVDAALRQLHRAVGREQVGEIVEQVLVEVVAVRALQILQLPEVLHPLEPALRRRQHGSRIIDLRRADLAAQRYAASPRPSPRSDRPPAG